MRIISGIYKNREIMGYDISGTRPTMDRVRESLFSMIQGYIKDSVVLDLFAGTGALGFECLSMGSSKCYFVDKNIVSINTIKSTASKFGESNLEVLNYDYNKALNSFVSNGISFDVIFLDPPYNMGVIGDIIDFIYSNNLLNKGGIIVTEFENDFVCNKYDVIKDKKYGSKKVRVYKNN